MFLVALLAGAWTTGCARPEPSQFTVGRAGSPPWTTAGPPGTSVGFTVTAFDVEGAGDPASVERVKAAVQTTFSRYLQDAVLTPLRSGGPAGELAPLFTARAAEHLAGAADRRAFIDEGLPPAWRIEAPVSALRLVGLADQAGQVVLVAARMDLKLLAGVPGTTVTIDRGADLVLVADGDGWKIDAYSVRVTRDTPDSSTTVVAGQ